MAYHLRDMVLHQRVGFSDFLYPLDEGRLADPVCFRPGKLDDQVVVLSNYLRILRDYGQVGLTPASNRTCRAPSKIDPAIGEIRWKQIDPRVTLEDGFNDVHIIVVIPHWADW